MSDGQPSLVQYNSDREFLDKTTRSSGGSDIRTGTFSDDQYFIVAGCAAGQLLSQNPTVLTGRRAYRTVIVNATVNNTRVVGVALETVPANSWVRVRKGGLIVNDPLVEFDAGFSASVTTAVGLGPLRASATAGRMEAGVVGTDHIIAFNGVIAALNLSPYVDMLIR